MRESLTIFAIAVILCLSALLVGPYLIDWNSQRAWLASKLSHAIGATVRIAGPIDVKLLPQPIFRAGQVSIEGATPHDPRFSAERLDAELSINGLLEGTVEFVDARITAPRIEVTMRHDGSVVMPAVDVKSPQKIQFQHVTVSDGTVAVLDEDGRPALSLSGIAATGEADSLVGPLKLTGSADSKQGPLSIRLTTGALSNGRLRVGLAVDHKGGWSTFAADGTVLTGSPAGKPARSNALGFEGNLKLAGELHLADGAAPVPWSVTSAGTSADLRNLAAPAIELRAGQNGRALVAAGSGVFGWAGDAAGIVKLRARQLDLDHIAVPPDVAPDTPKPSAAQWVAALRSGLGDAAPLPLRLKLDLGLDAITYGDLTLTDAAVGLDARAGAAPHAVASIAGPNGSRAALEGALDTGAAPSFSGTLDVATRDAATASTWLAPFLPTLLPGVVLPPDQPFAFRGSVDVSPVGLVARSATVTAAGSSLTGTLSLTAGIDGERPRVFADITAGSFDPGRWPDLHDLMTWTQPLDLNLALRSDAVAFSQTPAGSGASGHVALHLTKKNQVVALDQFQLSGFNGADFAATASLDAEKHLRGEGRASATDVAILATLVKQVSPGPMADAVLARAAALSPLDASFKAEGVVSDIGVVTPTSLSVSGTLAGTRFSGTVTPGQPSEASSSLVGSLVLDAPEGARLLAQAGVTIGGQLGPLHLESHGEGSLAEGFATRLSATLPGTQLTFAGRLDASSGQLRLDVRGTDVKPVLHAFGIGAVPMDRSWSASGDVSWSDDAVSLHALAGRLAGSSFAGALDYARAVPPDQTGTPPLTGSITADTATLGALAGISLGSARLDGAKASELWSGQPFAAAPSLLSADLGLKVGALELWPGIISHDVGMKMELRSGAVTLADMAGRVLGGSAGGTVTLRRVGPSASVTGQVSFDDLALSLPSLAGRLSGKLNLAGTGTTPAALAGSFAGDGSLSLATAVIPRLDPGALGAVAARFNADSDAVEDGPVREALAAALDGHSVALGTLAGPATVAAGVVRLSGVAAALPQGTAVSDAAFSLADLSLTLRTVLTTNVLPKDWTGDPPRVTVTWKGPLGAPVRDVDAGAFVNGLAARAIAREQERIELMKDDLRERAFFARRLRQIEAEQQAVHDSAQALKAAPQPPLRPSDIRLPKLPDVGAPSLAPLPRSSDATSGPQDPIGRLINSQAGARPTARAVSGRPIELAPAIKAPPLPSHAPVGSDPAQSGQF